MTAAELIAKQPLHGNCGFCWRAHVWNVQLRLDGGPPDYVLANENAPTCNGLGNEGKPCRPRQALGMPADPLARVKISRRPKGKR